MEALIRLGYWSHRRLLLLSSSSSPLCRVFILIFLRQTMSLGNTLLQLFCCLLLFMVLISLVSVLNLLYFYISTFLSMCAVPNMAVFWSSLTSCFPGIMFTYYYYYHYYYYYVITDVTFVMFKWQFKVNP